MKKTPSPLWLKCIPLLLLLGAPSDGVRAQGIPEPSLIMYGTVRAVSENVNLRLTVGTLTWQFQAGASLVTISTPLTNINDQFCYILRVPAETPAAGFPITTNTLRLVAASTAYTRSASIDLGVPTQASLLPPALASLPLASADRGRIERVDLQVSLLFVDEDGNGLLDLWERQFFGHTGLDPADDPDGDGLNNMAEMLAGTDPDDPDSVFKFISVLPEPLGGTRVEWASAEGKTYRLQRSSDLLTGFTNVATQILGTPPKNSHLDATAAPARLYFYRLQLEQ